MPGYRHIIIGLAAATVLGLAPAGAQAQYYKGKTITLLFGYSPGGAMGTQTSLIQPFLEKHIPGNPKVVVKSMPGGGGMKAQNWLYDKGPKNGMTLLYTPTASQSQLLGQKGVRFDYAKFTVIGALNATPMLSYARKDAVPGGLKKPGDIVKAAKTLKLAGLRSTAWYDMMTRLSLDLMGVKYSYVPGYRGGAKVSNALRRNEGQVAGAPMVSYVARYHASMGGPKGIIMPLWYWPFKGASGKYIKDNSAQKLGIPMFHEVYKQVHSKPPSGQKWQALKFLGDLREAVTNVFFGAPGLNNQAKAAFRAGVASMVKDPGFGPALQKVIGSPLTPVSIAHAEKTFANMDKADPKLVGFLRKYVALTSK